MGVGRLYKRDPPHHGAHLTATLLMPDSAISTAATCLASLWKYIHIWTFDEGVDEAGVRAFSFSREVHDNLSGWIAGEARKVK